MARPYRFETYRDGDYWAAECEDLPGLVAGHETWDGLGAAIEDAKRTYFESALERGIPIPEPSQERESYSGRLMLRLPKSLHRQAARRAQREGVSLNAFVASAVAREIGPSRIAEASEDTTFRAIDLSWQDRPHESWRPATIMLGDRDRLVMMTSDSEAESVREVDLSGWLREAVGRAIRDVAASGEGSESVDKDSRKRSSG
jgi:antitoxin HicB